MDRLAAMETFVRVVDTGSFSEAARQLRVGQPAVSKSIALLEDRLEVRLLLRSTRGLAVTEAGHNFYERAKRAIEEADEADLAARGAGAGLSGRLRICAAVSFASIHVIPHLPQFLEENPGLDMEVILDDRNIDLIEEGIDIALRMGTLTDSTLIARKISVGRRSVIGTPEYFARAGTPGAPGDLIGHDCVVYSKGSGGDVWAFEQGSAKVTVTVKGRVRVSAAEGVRSAVLSGIGLTIASEWMFAPELKSGKALVVLKDWSIPAVDLWAVFPTGKLASAKARAFATFVEQRLAEADDSTLEV